MEKIRGLVRPFVYARIVKMLRHVLKKYPHTFKETN